MQQPIEVRRSAEAIVNAMNDVGKIVIGRQKVLTQIMYALATRNHVLMEGPPGIAKSYLAKHALGCIQGSEYFKLQCTKKMTEDYVVGPLDMRRFREEGEYYHRVEGYLPTAQYAFMDEFLDLTTGALRALLEVLNERSFSRGPQSVKCPLGTAIAATNFSGESEIALEAVMDRFLFRAKLKGLDAKQRLAMMQAVESVPEARTFSHQDVLRVNQAVKRVTVPESVLKVYVALCGHLNLTDRTVVKALDVVRASAVFKGRCIAMLEDLTALGNCLSVSGDNASEKAFSDAMTATYAPAIRARGQCLDATLLANRSAALRNMIDAAKTYAEIAAAAIEVCEVDKALTHFQIPENTHIIATGQLQCQAALNRADYLYNLENKE